MKSQLDELTGLPNLEVMKATLQEAATTADGVALGLVDIDHFLEINSEFDHAVGDRVLQVLASLLTEAAPQRAYRISGDEFGVVLPGLSLEQAFLRLEALRARVADSTQRFALPDGRGVTITIGVAQYPRDAKDVQALIKAADSGLMSAKEGGRDQVALPPNEEMVMKSCYYPASGVRKLKALAERLDRKESRLLREALDDLLRKYDTRREE